MEKLNRGNFSCRLHKFIEQEQLSASQIAIAIGSSEATINRLLKKQTVASNEMLNQANLMLYLGFKKYSKLSDANKKKILELAGGVGGGAVGFGAIALAINSLGLAGLSAAGITSGLAALGGSMMGGVMFAAGAPVLIGGIGYLGVRGVKQILSYNKLKAQDIDLYWESIPTVEDDMTEEEFDFLSSTATKILVFAVLSFVIIHYL